MEASSRLQHNGTLKLHFRHDGRRCILNDVYQTPPLKVMRPLYINQNDTQEAEVILVDTSGGLLPGNHNRFEITLDSGAHVALRPQAATLIHPSFDGSVSKQDIVIELKE
ncbi:MAG: urease accessory protein UreD, partial [Coriobacteriia bacterium]|nr:urease accessory protein UreD [Coriobacteriia bacterium]